MDYKKRTGIGLAAMEAGMNAHLAKPVQMKLLYDTIKQFLL